MGKFRYGIALLAAKLSVLALKITRHNGTNFPGIVALKICPDFLKYIHKPKTIIGVTGTNGKTTVSNMLNDLLSKLGRNVLNNGMGSNINTGIATCLISGVTLFGREKYDTAVLEIDERSARVVFPYVQPDLMLISNLSRDSIMRNGHPEYIKYILERYMPEKTRLVLNADYLIASSVSPENPRVYYGIDQMPGDFTECRNLINDMQICPKCHTKLKYKYIRYSNIGKAYCPNCDFKSPEYDCEAKDVDVSTMTMQYSGGGESAEFKLMNPSVFNIYNQVSAIAVLQQMDYSLDQIKHAMEQIQITSSRYGVHKIGDKTVRNILCKEKNAYAASRVFEYVGEQPGTKEILLFNNCIGDTHHWSENTCWLYDCDFEFLADDKIRQIIVYGDRGLDYKLRMLIAGVPEERITYVKDPADGVGKLKMLPDDNIYVFYGTDSFNLGMRTTKEAEAAVAAWNDAHGSKNAENESDRKEEA